MSKYLGKDVSMALDNEGYNYDSVVFKNGKPFLDSELNFLQQAQQDMLRKVAATSGSGWVSFREPHAEPGNPSAFFTQKEEGSLPEVALINGWPVHVTNTNTTTPNLNKVDMSEFPLVAGARADGVFLEVWRGLVSDAMAGVTSPKDFTQIGVLRCVEAVTKDLVWAAGDSGLLLKTVDGGASWDSPPSPTVSTIHAIKFLDAKVGFLAGAKGTLFKTEDGGATWAKISLPVADDLYTIATSGPSLMVLAGAKGTILRSTDMYNFELVANTDQTSQGVHSVYFYDTLTGWACGEEGLYLRTLDGGKTWRRYYIQVPSAVSSLQESKVTTQLNSVRFSNLSDGWIAGNEGTLLRTTDGGTRWASVAGSIVDENGQGYSLSENLYDMVVISSLPLRISLALKDGTTYFTEASYSLGTQVLTLAFTVVGGERVTRQLVLANFATDQDLLEAINAVSYGGHVVFSASLSYTSTAYQSHVSTESIDAEKKTAELRFSMGDQLWVVGANGAVLQTQNGGASWTKKSATVSADAYGISMLDASKGWVVGDQGEIACYDASLSGSGWEGQDTDLVTKTQKKVFYTGNVSSPAALNLNNDMVHPSVRVETTSRTQVQYKIRVVEGVDIHNFRDAGLGSSYVFSQGPNSSVLGAGSYSFENMGPISGDFSLWRAPCRNTVDGYSYAIPMFLVTLRNQQPYNASTNINGTSSDAVNAIRPDGLTYEDITLEDVLDIRRKVAPLQAGTLMESAFDDLLASKLHTSMVSSSLKGGQVGAYLTEVDTLGTEALGTLFGGLYNSRAQEVTPDPLVVPGVSGQSLPQIALPSLTDGMYQHSPSYYSATYVSTADATVGLSGMNIPGYFTGMGTPQALFVFGETGVQQEGVNYEVRSSHILYTPAGTSNVPARPLQVKSFTAGRPTESVNYQGVEKTTLAKKVRQLQTGINGYQDYVEISGNAFGDASTSASMVRLHLFMEVGTATDTLKVPKNNEGYFVHAVRSVSNLEDGGAYRIASVSPSDKDDTSVLVINLSSTYKVVQGTLLEIVLEVVAVADSENSGAVGQISSDKGESVDATRGSYVATFDSSVKGVSALYKGVLVEVPLSAGEFSLVGLGQGEILGVSTMTVLDGDRVPYAWSFEDDKVGNTILGTVTKDASGSFLSFKPTSGTTPAKVLLPLLVREVSSSLSSASVSYQRQAPQTLQPLPASLEVQVLACADGMTVLSSGDGGGAHPDYYTNSLEQLALYDNRANQSFFFNLFGLEFNSFFEPDGHVYLPMRVRRHPGQVVTLGSSGVDTMGRTFYRTSSEKMTFIGEGMSLGNPRKIAVPMLVKVVSSILSPALKGEVLLAVATTYDNTSLENKVLIGPEAGKSVVSLYKVPGMPVIK